MSAAVELTLSDEQLLRLARAVADELEARRTTAPAVAAPRELVSAPVLARRLGVSAKTVYRHASDLGGGRVGGALRFEVEQALAAWAERGGERSRSESPQPPPVPVAAGRKATRKPRATSSHCQLLPVGRVQDGRARPEPPRGGGASSKRGRAA